MENSRGDLEGTHYHKGLKELMTQAMRALKAGRKEEAFRLFSQVVDSDLTNEDALLGKAGCSSDSGETILQSDPGANPLGSRG